MSLNHFLHVLSGSLNLIILSSTGSQFRNTLRNIFGIRKEGNLRQTITRFSTKITQEIVEVGNVDFNGGNISPNEFPMIGISQQPFSIS